MFPQTTRSTPSAVHFVRGDRISHIAVIGHLGATAGHQVSACAAALVGQGTQWLVVDLHRTSHMDRAGLRALVGSATYAGSQGVQLDIVGAQGQPRILIECSAQAPDVRCTPAARSSIRRRPRR